MSNGISIKGIVDANLAVHHVDHEYLDNNPPIPEADDTLSIPGKYADAARVGAELSDLKEDLTNSFDAVYTGNYKPFLTKTASIPLGDYSIGDVVDVSPLENSGTHYTLLIDNVSPGETFFVNLADGTISKPWAFLDVDYKLLSVSSSSTAGNTIITAPTGAKYLILQCGTVDPSHYNNAIVVRNECFEYIRNGIKFNYIGLPNNAKIDITDTTIVIPSLTRIFYGNGNTYRTSGLTTMNRVATPDSAFSEEIVVLNVNNYTFRCVAGNAFSTIVDNDYVLFTLSKGNNGCSLPPSMYTYSGKTVYKTRCNYIGLPNNAKINITDTTVVVPSLTRIFYGNGNTYRTLGLTTVNRIAVPNGAYSEEIVVFNSANFEFRCLGGNNYTALGNDDVVLFTMSKGNDSCSLAPTMYTYNGSEIYARQNVETGINKYNDIIDITNKLENASNVAQNDTGTAVKNRTHLLNLLYFSDIHGSTGNIERILQFYNTYQDYIFSVIHCGDSVSVNHEDANPFATVGGDTVLNVIGNHEAWKTGATWPTPYNATAEECYTKFIAPYISAWDVESAGINLCYYYKDYTNGFRLIVLDSIHWDSAQKTWLENTLTSAKTAGLSVIIASHYPPQSGITGFDCTFNSLTQSINAVTPGVNQMERMPDDAYDVVDDYIEDGGEFVCWLNGHTHDDFIGTVNNHTNQIAIVISCALTSNKYSDCARRFYTKTQDLFNVFTADNSAKLIKLIRVGSTMDKFMRSRETLCVNYNTKQIISNT